MHPTLISPSSIAGRTAGAYPNSLRQHYRPAVVQVPRWLRRVWLWF